VFVFIMATDYCEVRAELLPSPGGGDKSRRVTFVHIANIATVLTLDPYEISPRVNSV